VTKALKVAEEAEAAKAVKKTKVVVEKSNLGE
jgi:hypothetical protein